MFITFFFGAAHAVRALNGGGFRIALNCVEMKPQTSNPPDNAWI